MADTFTIWSDATEPIYTGLSSEDCYKTFVNLISSGLSDEIYVQNESTNEEFESPRVFREAYGIDL